MQVIIFELNERFYGFTTTFVDEITGPLASTSIPQGVAWAHGLINLRGQIMTLIDMDTLLGRSSSVNTMWYNNTIIINADDNPIALMVGKVLGVVDISDEDIHATSDDDDGQVLGYISAYNEVITMIALDPILKEKEGVA